MAIIFLNFFLKNKMQTHYKEIWGFWGFLDEASNGDGAITHLQVSQCDSKPESPISSKLMQHHVN